jgi:iron-sulfur cluster repair protein YtfE (RIC family)
MKRHKALAHLSREHHGALILSRLIQKNAPAYKELPLTTEGKVDYALKFYESELITHFKDEEGVLNLVKRINAELDLLIEIILKEHEDLHVKFQSLRQPSDFIVKLDQLGKMLENHVRKEERELFPLIQEICNEDVMKNIETLLTKASN